MVHPDTELRHVNDSIGWGVFATKPIAKGTITWALDALDRQFTATEVDALPTYARDVLATYSYMDGAGRFVLCWDHARFYNHHCDANCLSVGYDFEMAIRDIAAGDELTDDYGTLNLTAPFDCRCESQSCRGVLLPDDMERHGDRWNALARDAFFRIPDVPQPLWDAVSERDLIEAALTDPSRLRPIQHHYAALRIR